LLAGNSQAWIDAQWDEFDMQLQQVLWTHAKLLQGSSIHDCVADMFASGQLLPYLEHEKQGWEESQAHDMDVLKNEVAGEFEETLARFRDRLGDLTPLSVTCHERTSDLQALAEADAQRLDVILQDTIASYRAEIRTTMEKAQVEFWAFDAELQAIAERTLRSRLDDMAHMRRLKLALCRWRLDYQHAFHEHISSTWSKPQPQVTKRLEPLPDRGIQIRLDSLRQAVRELWTTNEVPDSEIRRFLDKVSDAAAKEGRAAPLEQVYRTQLSGYGALPVLEHSDQPEMLDIWLQTLRGGALPDTGRRGGGSGLISGFSSESETTRM